jgi:hypothetical protein
VMSPIVRVPAKWKLHFGKSLVSSEDEGLDVKASLCSCVVEKHLD